MEEPKENETVPFNRDMQIGSMTIDHCVDQIRACIKHAMISAMEAAKIRRHLTNFSSKEEAMSDSKGIDLMRRHHDDLTTFVIEFSKTIGELDRHVVAQGKFFIEHIEDLVEVACNAVITGHLFHNVLLEIWGGTSYNNLALPLGWVLSSLRVYFGRWLRKGLFLCDGEAAAFDLLGISFVHIRHDLFESCGIEAIGEHRSPAYNVCTGYKLFGILLIHLCFDGISESFGFILGFLHQCFPLFQFFDFADDFLFAHIHSPLMFCLVLADLVISLYTNNRG